MAGNSNIDKVQSNKLLTAENTATATNDSIERKSSPSGSLEESSCRICLDVTKEEPLITPCLCKGSISFVHQSCLERWLGTKNAQICELCNYKYQTSRRPRYGVLESIFLWLFTRTEDSSGHRCFTCDFLFSIVLTPVFMIIIYVCITIANHYQQTVELASKSSWAHLSLTLMAAILAYGLYFWLKLMFQSCSKSWYAWWHENNIVRLHHTTAPSTHKNLKIETSFV